MATFSIAENFAQYFEIQIAVDEKLKSESFKIRHKVYCEELGWETTNEACQEVDECDGYSFAILLVHKRTGAYAGTVRYVIPPLWSRDKKLPFELHCLSTLKRDIVDPDTLPRGTFGEVSRLAVPESFRRRKDEKNKPFIVTEIAEENVFSEEEKRNFPNIALGLYLSAMAMAKLCNHSHMFVVIEPSLRRMLKRLGLHFKQCGEELEYHGVRAIFYLTKEEYTTNLNEEMLSLHDLLVVQLMEQMALYPYVPFSKAAS